MGGDDQLMPGDLLPTAVRAWAPPDDWTPRAARRNAPSLPKLALVFDTETTVDATQRLTFGWWRVLKEGSTIDEGLFHGDDLGEDDLAALRDYAASHESDTPERGPIRLLRRRAFLNDVFWPMAYKARALVVGFNLPFDLSRLAFAWGIARGDPYGGGFSLALWEYQRDGQWLENKYRSRITIKAIDSKRALIGFAKRRNPDSEDLIPEGSRDGTPDPVYIFPGYFLDLKSLAFALTNESYSLDRACKAFGVKHAKLKVETHGVITPDYIDYARRDVLTTSELLQKLLAEHAKHPIALFPSKAFSPASVGKRYLEAMGVQPPLVRQSDFPYEVLGYAMSSYYGGRAECRIRNTIVPVIYLDFLSMYPTVNTLMGLWEFLIAERIETVESTEDIRAFLTAVTLDHGFLPETWERLPALVLVEPDHDIFPIRGKYGATASWQIGLNELEAGEPRWWTLADCIASTLLSGKPPRIQKALRFTPEGRQAGLKSVSLRGTVEVDPARGDFFRAVIEERKSLPDVLETGERDRLGQFLKVLANSTSYGVFAEMNRQETVAKQRTTITVHGVDADPFVATVSGAEEPGDFCFPLLAAFIAGAARLMLAMLERCVSDLGGTYAFCDTDSMAIVATENGGLIPCPGGTERLRRKPAIRALSWKQVRGLQERFNALHPFDRSLVRGDVLELEGINFAENGKQRQLFCLAISAKRYGLYSREADGTPDLVKWSEHGLGHLLNPTDPELEDCDWMRQLWEGLIREELGLRQTWPAWLDRPALSRITISSPALLRPFKAFNAGKPYAQQIKPFNFLLTAHVKAFGHPDRIDPEHFQLFAPYEADATKWERLPWVDRYAGESYRISTTGPTGGPGFARVQTYRDVLGDFRHHPEAKSADAFGRPSDRQTVGLLRRRDVHTVPTLLTYIGKESNKLEEVEEGIEHDLDEIMTEYADPRRDPWRELVVPVLQEIPSKQLAQAAGISERSIRKIRNERSRPNVRHHEKLVQAAGEFARNWLRAQGLTPPSDNSTACAVYLVQQQEIEKGSPDLDGDYP
jgi:hypothetical protein